MPHSFNRRDFLKSSAVAAATAALPLSALRAQTQPSETLNIAIIGAGGQGSRITENLLLVPGTRLVAICEIMPPNAQRWTSRVPDATLYDDWNEMLAAERDLDAVLIGLPEHTHAAAAIAALEAGKHVFCEKPMAYSLEEGRAMIAARDAAGKVLQIGQQRRSNPLYYYAHKRIQQDGLIGEILRVDAFWDRWADWKRPLPEGVDRDFSPWGFPSLDHLVNWRLYRAYSHGLMTENGTHQLDATSWLTGGKRPQYVCGMGAIRYLDHRETHDIASAEYMYDGETIVRFTQDFHQGLNYGWEYGELLLGDEGAVRVTEERHIVHYPRDNKQGIELDVAELGEIEFPGVTYTAEQLAAVEDFRQFSYENEMLIFANCVRQGLQPTCTAEIGHNSIVPTILGTVAQFEKQYVEFEEGMFV